MQTHDHPSKTTPRRLGYVCLVAMLLVGTQIAISEGVTEPAGTMQTTGTDLPKVWDGVYTDSQASAGQKVFQAKCDGCHGEVIAGDAEFQGPPLKGDKFFENWREDHVGSLYNKIRSSMPLHQPSLSDPEYLVVVAFILRENGFPSGEIELDANSVRTVWIEGKDGPRPLPGNSLVQTVGCLVTRDGEWILAAAGRPIRDRDPDPEKRPTPERLRASALEQPGTLTFQLTNFFMLGDFDPAAHEGQRMLARGALIRRTSGDRISVTGLDMVSSNCSP
jgi:mono/diheme cytochrome c family protein